MKATIIITVNRLEDYDDGLDNLTIPQIKESIEDLLEDSLQNDFPWDDLNIKIE